MVGDNLKEGQLQQIVDKTIIQARARAARRGAPTDPARQADKDKDGRISFEEFCAMVENTDIVSQLTLPAI